MTMRVDSDDVRMRTVVTALRIARYVQRPGVVQLHRVAAHFDIHHRTARRYLMALEAAGWPVPPWRREDVPRRRRAVKAARG